MENVDLSTISDLDLWSGVVGFMLPLLIALIVRSHWAPQLKGAVTFAVCVAGGGVTAWLTGYLHGVNILRAVLVVLASTLAFYRIFWHPTYIAPTIEDATTPRNRRW